MLNRETRGGVSIRAIPWRRTLFSWWQGKVGHNGVCKTIKETKKKREPQIMSSGGETFSEKTNRKICAPPAWSELQALSCKGSWH